MVHCLPPLLPPLLLPPPPLLPAPSPPAAFLWLLMDLSWITETQILFWIVCVPVTLVSCDMVFTTARKAGELLVCLREMQAQACFNLSNAEPLCFNLSNAETLCFNLSNAETLCFACRYRLPYRPFALHSPGAKLMISPPPPPPPPPSPPPPPPSPPSLCRACGISAIYSGYLETCIMYRYPSHTSHVTRHTSHVTRHTSHVTRHTSHVTRHTSHVTSRS